MTKAAILLLLALLSAAAIGLYTLFLKTPWANPSCHCHFVRRTGDAVPAPVWCDPAECNPPNLCLWEDGEADSTIFSCPFSSLGQVLANSMFQRLLKDLTASENVIWSFAAATTPVSTPRRPQAVEPRALLEAKLRGGLRLPEQIQGVSLRTLLLNPYPLQWWRY